MIISEKKKKILEEKIGYFLRQHELNHSACGYYIVPVHNEEMDIIGAGKEEEDRESVETLGFYFNCLQITCVELKNKNYLFNIECQKIEKDGKKTIRKFKEFESRIYKNIEFGFIGILQDYLEEIKEYKVI